MIIGKRLDTNKTDIVGGKMEKVVYEINKQASYPDSGNDYNPSKVYPEYIFGPGHVCENENIVYDMVRNCFADMRLDKEHFGLSNWNPLGEIINEGDTVVLKPNMVISNHPNIECIVTNPSIVRAVIDYVCIALKGTGKIILGDAPMQRCDFNELLESIGYYKMLKFYEDEGINVEVIDFRNFISDYSTQEISILKDVDNLDDYICVDLGKESLLCPQDKHYKNYRVTNYDYRKMRLYHNKKHHKYLIRKEMLQADVIISLPKPKTHRKAGYTAALKNFVGTVVHKECLPHHIKGAIFFGGNEYLHPNFMKALRTYCFQKIDLANIYGKWRSIPYYKKILHFAERRIGYFSQDAYSEGSWYGNDTIWRTFGDINRILKYADKSGKMQCNAQRRMLFVGDMIIAGEGEGPVHAMPKNIGIILAGTNPYSFDMLVAKIMGFDFRKIPALRNLYSIDKYPIFTEKVTDIYISSHSDTISDVPLSELKFEFCFEPTSGWKNHIELEE